MQKGLRMAVIATIILSFLSFGWFLLVAYIRGGMDIIGTYVFWGAGIPVVLLSALLIIFLVKRWKPTSGADYVGLSATLVMLVLLSGSLIYNVHVHGWARETVRSDSLQITADAKYEYHIDLINVFKRNSHARLYLKDLGSGEEKHIPVDIQTRNIVVLGGKTINHWILLEPTDNETSLYTLYTTEELGIPEEKFDIDVAAGTSKRLQ